ncbi:MAG: hypothetical protein JO255_00280 [Alphaproteobacteria bacterium]|nr:hypothetical protein [Alphaproteobacteria bacterium]
MVDNATVETPPASQPTAEQIIARLKAQQNFALAIPAGIAAAIVGAAIWGAAVFATETKIGLIAVALGALVGYAIRGTGKGIEPKFGVLGAVCAAFGWALGTILSDVAFLAKHVDKPFLDVLASLGVERTLSFATNVSEPMDLLFLGIAVYEGYKFSFKYRLKKTAQPGQARPPSAPAPQA